LFDAFATDGFFFSGHLLLLRSFSLSSRVADRDIATFWSGRFPLLFSRLPLLFFVCTCSLSAVLRVFVFFFFPALCKRARSFHEFFVGCGPMFSALFLRERPCAARRPQ